MKRNIIDGLFSQLRRISDRLPGFLTGVGIGGGLTAEQQAGIERMERDYEELVGNRFRAPVGAQADPIPGREKAR